MTVLPSSNPSDSDTKGGGGGEGEIKSHIWLKYNLLCFAAKVTCPTFQDFFALLFFREKTSRKTEKENSFGREREREKKSESWKRHAGMLLLLFFGVQIWKNNWLLVLEGGGGQEFFFLRRYIEGGKRKKEEEEVCYRQKEGGRNVLIDIKKLERFLYFGQFFLFFFFEFQFFFLRPFFSQRNRPHCLFERGQQ